MKKITATLVAASLVMLNINAQEKDIELNTEKEQFSLDIAGFRIGLGTNDEDKKVEFSSKKRHSKVEFGLIGPLYFGWSCLTNDNYYGEWTDKGDFLRPRNCFTFGLSFCSITASLSEYIQINSGIRWSCTNYSFGNSVILKDDESGRTMPWFPVDDNYKVNSKMYHSYMGVPVGISYVNDKFALTFKISAEGLLTGYSKWENEDARHYFSALNKFKSRAEIMASYGLFGAFVSYDLTPMFVSGSGNDCHLMTFGFAVCL